MDSKEAILVFFFVNNFLYLLRCCPCDYFFIANFFNCLACLSCSFLSFFIADFVSSVPSARCVGTPLSSNLEYFPLYSSACWNRSFGSIFMRASFASSSVDSKSTDPGTGAAAAARRGDAAAAAVAAGGSPKPRLVRRWYCSGAAVGRLVLLEGGVKGRSRSRTSSFPLSVR